MIRLLDDLTIDKIAAGEVIERPVNVVKELVENAIDAGAGHISVEIRGGGIEYIRVTDNGSGISAEDMPKAFLRHATSKIATSEDLFFLNTLGFRGEALASIAAVSHTEMISKVSSELMGTKISLEGGNVKENIKTGAPEGTTIVVRDLFYNVPARMKFLGTPGSEATKIIELMEELILANPKIAIQLIVNRQVKLQSNGSGNLKDIIYRLYGKEVYDALLPFRYEDSFVKIDGYIAKPEVVRPSRSGENYFINSRYVKNDFINRGIEEGYRNFLMQHKYPFVVLFIDMDPFGIDINVHPAKKEVRITNGETLVGILSKFIRKTLTSYDLIPNAIDEPKEETPALERMPEPFEKELMKNTHEIKKGYDSQNTVSVPVENINPSIINDKSKEFTVEFEEDKPKTNSESDDLDLTFKKPESNIIKKESSLLFKPSTEDTKEMPKEEHTDSSDYKKTSLDDRFKEIEAAIKEAKEDNQKEDVREDNNGDLNSIKEITEKSADKEATESSKDIDESEEENKAKEESVESNSNEEITSKEETIDSDLSNEIATKEESEEKDISNEITDLNKEISDEENKDTESKEDEDVSVSESASEEKDNAEDIKSIISKDDSIEESENIKKDENSDSNEEKDNKPSEETKNFPVFDDETLKNLFSSKNDRIISTENKADENINFEKKTNESPVLKKKVSKKFDDDVEAIFKQFDSSDDFDVEEEEEEDIPVNKDEKTIFTSKFLKKNQEEETPVSPSFMNAARTPAKDDLFKIKKDFPGETEDRNAIEMVKTSKSYEEDKAKFQQKLRSDLQKEQQEVLFTEKSLDNAKIGDYEILGQVFDTYWLISLKGELLIMDQHAAHEKVLYEKYMKAFKENKIETQTLLVAKVVSLSKTEMEVFKNYKEEFEKFGFIINDFGERDLFIRGVPTDLFGADAKTLFLDILSELIEVSPSLHISTIEERIATRACKAAIKGRQRVGKIDCKKLFESLFELENPYQCPHGRPTIVRITNNDLEKMFKRIV